MCWHTIEAYIGCYHNKSSTLVPCISCYRINKDVHNTIVHLHRPLHHETTERILWIAGFCSKCRAGLCPPDPTKYHYADTSGEGKGKHKSTLMETMREKLTAKRTTTIVEKEDYDAQKLDEEKMHNQEVARAQEKKAHQRLMYRQKMLSDIKRWREKRKARAEAEAEKVTQEYVEQMERIVSRRRERRQENERVQ